MEIARLEVSTQNHLVLFYVNYIQYGKSTKHKKGKRSQHSTPSTGGDRGSRGHGTQSKPSGRGRKVPLPPVTEVAKRDIKKTWNAKLWKLSVGCNKKGHFEKVCLSAKYSTHSLEVPQASTSATGAGEPLYFDDQGQPVFNTHMVSVLHSNKHLIKFPIALDHGTLRSRGRNKMENSTDSTRHSKCSTVLLKADMGAVNLMNKQTFDQLFGARDLLQPTPIKMENYGNTAVKVLGRFHVFL